MKQLLEAKIFSDFQWTDITYQGTADDKILRFEVKMGESSRTLCLATILSKEEKMAWQSFEGVLDHTAGLAQAGLRGFFGFEIVSAELQAMQHFNPQELSRLLINHSKELGAGEKKLIRYGQLFGLLHYRAPAEWGKLEIKTRIEFFDAPSSSSGEVSEESVKAALLGGGGKKKTGGRFDLLFKKLVKTGGAGSITLVHDMSSQLLYDPTNESQRSQIQDWLKKEIAGGATPEIYIYHAGQMLTIN